MQVPSPVRPSPPSTVAAARRACGCMRAHLCIAGQLAAVVRKAQVRQRRLLDFAGAGARLRRRRRNHRRQHLRAHTRPHAHTSGVRRSQSHQRRRRRTRAPHDCCQRCVRRGSSSQGRRALAATQGGAAQSMPGGVAPDSPRSRQSAPCCAPRCRRRTAREARPWPSWRRSPWRGGRASSKAAHGCGGTPLTSLRGEGAWVDVRQRVEHKGRPSAILSRVGEGGECPASNRQWPHHTVRAL